MLPSIPTSVSFAPIICHFSILATKLDRTATKHAVLIHLNTFPCENEQMEEKPTV